MRRFLVVLLLLGLHLPALAQGESFTQDLSLGSQGPEVSFLQEVLQQDPSLYPEQQVTGTFDAATSDAVVRFQTRHGILREDAAGVVEESTREYLNAVIDERTSAEFNAGVLDAVNEFSRTASPRDAQTLAATLTARRREMVRILRTNPTQAALLRLSKKTRQRLPRDLRHLVEREVKLKGRLIRMTEDNFDAGYSVDRYILETKKGERYTIFAPDERLAPSPKAYVRGLVLNDTMLPDTSDKGVMIRVAQPIVQSPQRIIVLLLRFPDRPGPTVSAPQIDQRMQTVASYYQEVSYGRLATQWQVSGWHISTRPFAEFKEQCDRKPEDRDFDPFEAMQREAIRLADSSVDFTRFSHTMLVTPSSATCGGRSFAGFGQGSYDTDEGKVLMYSAVIQHETGIPTPAIHEIGHNAGLPHADFLHCPKSSIDPKPLVPTRCTRYEYGDRYDAMGTGIGHFSAPKKTQAGFFPAFAPERVISGSSGATYVLDVVEAAGSGPKALHLSRPNNQKLWFEYRQRVGFDVNFTPSERIEGTHIHLENLVANAGGSPNPSSHLLDVTPNATLNTLDVVLVPGRSFYDSLTQLAVTPVASSSTSVSLRVDRFAPITCSPATRAVGVGNPVVFTAEGGLAPLTWESPGSQPSAGSGNSFQAVFPNTGTFTVTVRSATHNLEAKCTVIAATQPVVSVTFNGSPEMTTVPYGTYVTVAWSAVNATGCWVRGSANQPTSGSYVAGPVYNPSFRSANIYCYNGPHGGPGTVYSEVQYPNWATGSYQYEPPPSGNNSRCVNVVAPAVVAPNESFSAEITMENTGTKSWTTNATPHRLGSRDVERGGPAADTNRWVTTRVGLPGPVNPGETVTFRIDAVAGPTETEPSTSYLPFDWQMVEDGIEWFGEGCRRNIAIRQNP